MSSLPPRQPSTDPHNLSQTANLQQATHKVNRFARRDPALYPLSAIVVGIFCVAGYFFMSKSTEAGPDRKLTQSGMVNPWDSSDKQDVHPSATAAFKYRHKTRDGHYEDSLPAMNEEIRNLKETAHHKFHTN